MKAVITITQKEKHTLLSCPNASKFLLHKKDRLFIDSVKSHNASLVDNDYELTRQITNTTSLFHPHLVELIVVEELTND